NGTVLGFSGPSAAPLPPGTVPMWEVNPRIRPGAVPSHSPGAKAGPPGGAGNNGPVSTARASSFLNCPGGAVARGWSLAWPERVAGVAGPLADLAALVSLGLPGVPGPLQVRGRGSGQPPSGAEGPELQVRLGQPPAAFGPRGRGDR